MSKAKLGWLLLALWCASAQAQERVYRCGNEYTNAAGSAQRKGCRLVQGGNVTVIKGTVPRPKSKSAETRAAAARAASSANPASGARVGSAAAPADRAQRVSASAQRERDADARTILEAELRRSQEQLDVLRHQGGADQTERRLEIERAQADIDAIEREIRRLR